MRLFEPTETEYPFSASCRGYCPPPLSPRLLSRKHHAVEFFRLRLADICEAFPMAKTTPSRGTISPTVGAARIIHANGGCTLAARGRDMCRPRSRGRKGRTTYINAGNRPILHVRAGKDTGCGSPDSLKDFRYTAGSSPRGGCCLPYT